MSLTSLLCVRAQLPTQLGGLESNVISIDGGNTFRLYQIVRLVQIHQLNPKQVLDNIFISRAFTAYQATSLITHQLKEAIKKYNAKLVIISDIAGFFLDKDIPDDEAQRIFSQVTTYLSNFAKENQTIIIATYPPTCRHNKKQLPPNLNMHKSKRCAISKKNKLRPKICFRKTPYLSSGIAELPPESLTLADFAEANA